MKARQATDGGPSGKGERGVLGPLIRVHGVCAHTAGARRGVPLGPCTPTAIMREWPPTRTGLSY